MTYSVQLPSHHNTTGSESIQHVPETERSKERKPHKISDGIRCYATAISMNVFAFIKIILQFPLRHLGARTWSLPGAMWRIFLLTRISKATKGAQSIFPDQRRQFSPSPLLQTNALLYTRYVFASSGAHSRRKDWKEFWFQSQGLTVVNCESLHLDTDTTSGSIIPQNFAFVDKYHNLKLVIAIHEKSQEVIISLGKYHALSSDKKKSKKLFSKLHIDDKYITSACSFLGGVPSRMNEVSSLIEKIKNHPMCAGKSITLCGSCYHGSIVSYAALKNRLHAVSFNTLPLGAGIQHDLGRETVLHANLFVTHIIAKNDIIADFMPGKIIGKICDFAGGRTPGNFGARFSIPKMPHGFWYNHTHFSRNFSEFLNNR